MKESERSPTPVPCVEELTRLLADANGGGKVSTDELLPIVYAELRRLASAKIAREAPGHTLQATALVHEAYLRLLGPSGASGQWENRRHFFGAAAEAMRRILVDHARRKSRRRKALDAQETRAVDDPAGALDDLLGLDEALKTLARHDPVKEQLVKLKFFCGLTTSECAEALGIPVRTTERHWAFARAWLYRELEGEARG